MQDLTDTDRFITPAMAASLLGITPSAVYGYVREKKLVGIRTNAGVLVDREDVEALLTTRRPADGFIRRPIEAFRSGTQLKL